MPKQRFYKEGGKTRPITPRGLYHTPRFKKYSEMLSGIHTHQQANDAVSCMLKEFNETSQRATKVRIKRAMVQRANQARVESRNKNLSFGTRSTASIIADTLEYGYQEMDIPPKSGTGVVITKIATSKDLSKPFTVVTWVNGKIIVKSKPSTVDKAKEHAKWEREAIAKGYYFNKPTTPSSTLKKEKAAVKDEHEGVVNYDKLAMLARDEGRTEDAKVYQQHAKDEARHAKEDQKIVDKATGA